MMTRSMRFFYEPQPSFVVFVVTIILAAFGVLPWWALALVLVAGIHIGWARR